MSEITDDGYRAADDIIDTLKQRGHGDYSDHRDTIALELYEEGIWQGNWDSRTDLGGDMPDLRLIQEDEYDQSMDEDEKPDWDDIIAQPSGGYLFFA